MVSDSIKGVTSSGIFLRKSSQFLTQFLERRPRPVHVQRLVGRYLERTDS